MARKLTNILVFSGADYDRDTGDEIQNAAGSNDVFEFIGTYPVYDQELGRPGEVRFTVARGCEWHTDDLLKARQRLYFVYDNADEVPYRITEVRTSGHGASDVEVTAVELWADLGDTVMRYERDPGNIATYYFPITNVTVANSLANFVFATAYGIDSLFAVDTSNLVTALADAPVIVEASASTHLDIISQIVEQGRTKEKATGEKYDLEFEWSYTPDGVNPGTYTCTFYDGEAGWTAAERTAGVADPTTRPIQTGRLESLKTDEQGDYFSRVIPHAGPVETGRNIGGAVWAGSASVTANVATVTLDDNIVYADDCYNGLYVDFYRPIVISGSLTWLPAERYSVTDSTYPNLLSVDVTSATYQTGINSAAAIRFADSSDSQYQTNLIDAAAEADRGRVDQVIHYEDVPPFDNLFAFGLHNDDFTTLSAGSPDMTSTTTDGAGNVIPDGFSLITAQGAADMYEILFEDVTTDQHTCTVHGDITGQLAVSDTVTVVNVGDGWNGTYTVGATPTYDGGNDRTSFRMDGTTNATEDFGTLAVGSGSYLAFDANAVTAAETGSLYVRHGTQSIKVTADLVGTGLISNVFRLDQGVGTGIGTGLNSLSCSVGVYVESGAVRVRFVDAPNDGALSSQPPLFGDQAQSDSTELVSLEVGGIDIENPSSPGTNIATWQLVVEAVRPDTVFYLDSVAVTNSSNPYAYQLDMGQRGAWRRGIKELVRDGGVKDETYEAKVAEVTGVPITEDILVGSWVRVNDFRNYAGTYAWADKDLRVIAMTGGEDPFQGFVIKNVTLSKTRPDVAYRFRRSRVSSAPVEAPAVSKALVGQVKVIKSETEFITQAAPELFWSDTLRGGNFILDSSLGPEDADGGVIFAAATGTAYRRVYSGPADARWWGATINGSTDDSDAINKALQAVLNLDEKTLWVGGGDTCYIGSTTITVPNFVSLQQAPNCDFLFDGTTGVAVDLIGTATPDTDGRSEEVHRVSVRRDALEWTVAGGGSDTGSVGVRVYNKRNAQIHINVCEWFKVGLRVTGDGGGCVNNHFYLNRFRDCETSIHFQTLSSGWANQNQFFGGHLGMTSATSGEGSGPILMHLDGTGNGSGFYGLNCETGTGARVIYCDEVPYVQWINCRWEDAGTDTLVFVGSSTHSNLIVGGYDIWGYDGDAIDDQSTSTVTPYGVNVIGAGRQGPVYVGDDGSFGGPAITLHGKASGAAELIRGMSISSEQVIELDATGDLKFWKSGGKAGWTSPHMELRASSGTMYLGTGNGAAVRLFYVAGSAGSEVIVLDENTTFAFGTVSQSVYDTNADADAVLADNRVYEDRNGYMRIVRPGIADAFVIREPVMQFNDAGTGELEMNTGFIDNVQYIDIKPPDAATHTFLNFQDSTGVTKIYQKYDYVNDRLAWSVDGFERFYMGADGTGDSYFGAGAVPGTTEGFRFTPRGARTDFTIVTGGTTTINQKTRVNGLQLTDNQAVVNSGFLSLYSDANGLLQMRKGNAAAIGIVNVGTGTSDPGVNEDIGDGFIVGSLYYNTTSTEAFICDDNSSGAAVWTSLNASGGGDVTASANITDNALVRGDGGGKGIQESGITVSDTDALTGVDQITVDTSGAVGGAIEGGIAWKVHGQLRATSTAHLNGAVTIGGATTFQGNAALDDSTTNVVLHFDGDTDTGIRHTAANTMQFRTGGTDRVMLSDSAVEIDVDINHDGTNVGFYGATPVAQAAHIADPSGGATVDSEARTAIDAILVVLENLGLTATS